MLYLSEYRTRDRYWVSGMAKQDSENLSSDIQQRLYADIYIHSYISIEKPFC